MDAQRRQPGSEAKKLGRRRASWRGLTLAGAVLTLFLVSAVPFHSSARIEEPPQSASLDLARVWLNVMNDMPQDVSADALLGREQVPASMLDVLQQHQVTLEEFIRMGQAVELERRRIEQVVDPLEGLDEALDGVPLPQGVQPVAAPADSVAEILRGHRSAVERLQSRSGDNR